MCAIFPYESHLGPFNKTDGLISHFYQLPRTFLFYLFFYDFNYRTFNICRIFILKCSSTECH